jgi:hypothetical protein
METADLEKKTARREAVIEAAKTKCANVGVFENFLGGAVYAGENNFSSY